MTLNEAVGRAIKLARKVNGLRQDDFSMVSSRPYIFQLEKGAKSPTVGKLHEIATKIGVHPLTLLTHAYLELNPEEKIDALLGRVQSELENLQRNTDPSD